MVYGAINKKGEEYYTYLPKLFDAIDNAQLRYNWLVTACECNVSNRVQDDYEKQGYCWISGEDLTALVAQQKIQWIWAVFSGFEKDIPLEKALKHLNPNADEHPGFWRNPISMQNPLATLEIVPVDSSFTLFLSNNKELVDKFRAGYPLSEDLAAHYAKYD